MFIDVQSDCSADGGISVRVVRTFNFYRCNHPFVIADPAFWRKLGSQNESSVCHICTVLVHPYLTEEAVSHV